MFLFSFLAKNYFPNTPKISGKKLAFQTNIFGELFTFQK